MLLTAAISTGCGSTRLDRSWRSPEFQVPFRKLLVIGVASSADVARTYEDAFVEQLRARGIDAVVGSVLLAGPRPPDKSAIARAAADSGADGVLLTRLAKVEKKDVIIPPEPGVRDEIDSAWPGTYTPEVAGQIDVVTLETRLFDATAMSLVWSGTTETFTRATLQRAVRDAVHAVMKELARQKLLPSPL